jgi:hypothetical protein
MTCTYPLLDYGACTYPLLVSGACTYPLLDDGACTCYPYEEAGFLFVHQKKYINITEGITVARMSAMTLMVS